MGKRKKKNNLLILNFKTQNCRMRGSVALHYVWYLVDARCKSVGVLLAEVRAGGAGALSRDPAEGAAATSLTEADRDLLSGGDLTWLLVHGPVGPGG